MKRFLINSLFILIVNGAFSNTNTYSKLSLITEYGFTYFYGDLSPTPPNLFPKSFSDLVFGFTAEYALSPVWGLSADYYHLPISGRNQIAFFETNLHNSNLNVTFNFTKWIFPQTSSKFSLNGSLGVGVALFKANYKYPDPINSPQQSTPNILLSSVLPVSFLVEYDLNRSFSFGIRAHYSAFNSDNLEGVPYLNFKGVTNDYIGLLSLTARYKFSISKKPHLRNINSWDFIDKQELAINNEDSCNSCSALELAVHNSNAIDSLRINSKQLKLQLDSVLTLLNNYSVDTDGDGVSDFIDKCANTPAKVRGLVDKRGCPLDSDLDGIYDYVDNCPNIPD